MGLKQFRTGIIIWLVIILSIYAGIGIVIWLQ